MIFGLQHEIPSTKILALVVLAAAILLLAARFGFFGDGESVNGGSRGVGRRYQCQRCGTYFQPEQVEQMEDGQERRNIDDRCPHCGWNKDWRDDNRDNHPDGIGGWGR